MLINYTNKEYKLIYQNMHRHLFEYIKKHKLKSLVLGVSGGIDSALVAAIAYPVCKAANIPLFGYCLPIETNSISEVQRAQAIMKHFCTYSLTSDLSDVHIYHKCLLQSCGKNESEKDYLIRMGNDKARIRMIYLYDKAQFYKGCVLSTDNFTELMLGFWTLHGDVGDLGILQNLWKSEVYALSSFYCKNLKSKSATKSGDIQGAIYALGQCHVAIPSDGLGVTDSDLDQLEAKDYTEVDDLLSLYFSLTEALEIVKTQPDPGNTMAIHIQKQIDKIKHHPVIQRHLRSKFKRNNPYNFSREVIFKNCSTNKIG